MNANLNQQLTGGCTNLPGANERRYVVQGQTYRYRRYLGSIGLYWDAGNCGWVGHLPDGKVWFLKEKLSLDVSVVGQNPAREATERLQKLPSAPVRLTKKPAGPRRDEDAVTRWEDYSALPVKTKREAYVHEGLNINLRSCYWGCELCRDCMECVSNIEENDVLPHPELDFWNDPEENERQKAVLAVA